MFKDPNKNYLPNIEARKREEEFQNNILKLKEYLRENLQLAKDGAGNEYFSCGYNHTLSFPHPAWEPFKYLKKFCDERKLYWKTFLSDVEFELEQRFKCECCIVNSDIENGFGRNRLQSAFGIDFGSDCGFE